MQVFSFKRSGQFNKQSRLSERMIYDFGAVRGADKETLRERRHASWGFSITAPTEGNPL